MFNFKKKLFFVVLCTLLLTLSLGLCGTCYAISTTDVIEYSAMLSDPTYAVTYNKYIQAINTFTNYEERLEYAFFFFFSI